MDASWPLHKLSALSAERLEVLKQNAARRGDEALVREINDLQGSRRVRRSSHSSSPVIGFHFVCPDDYEVELLPDGRFWAGVWYVAEVHCAPAQEMSGYVALHQSRAALSRRQGTIVGWKRERRTKGKTETGISFLLAPFSEALPWYGEATGERGYRRVDDEPAWVPR